MLRAAAATVCDLKAIHAEVIVALVAHDARLLPLALRAEHLPRLQHVALTSVNS